MMHFGALQYITILLLPLYFIIILLVCMTQVVQEQGPDKFEFVQPPTISKVWLDRLVDWPTRCLGVYHRTLEDQRTLEDPGSCRLTASKQVVLVDRSAEQCCLVAAGSVVDLEDARWYRWCRCWSGWRRRTLGRWLLWLHLVQTTFDTLEVVDDWQ